MTDREIMQQALDALDYEAERGNDDGYRQLRDALRERLAQPEQEPAQRTWVGLTDEERNNLWRDVIGWGDPSHDDEDLMKAIEAKLKEKNT